DLPNGCVVAGFSADKQLAIGGDGWLIRKQFLQNGWRELATAAATMCQTRQSGHGRIHGRYSFSTAPRQTHCHPARYTGQEQKEKSILCRIEPRMPTRWRQM